MNVYIYIHAILACHIHAILACHMHLRILHCDTYNSFDKRYRYILLVSIILTFFECNVEYVRGWHQIPGFQPPHTKAIHSHPQPSDSRGIWPWKKPANSTASKHFECLPPGKDRWRATPMLLILSWPLTKTTIPHFWEWRSPSNFHQKSVENHQTFRTSGGISRISRVWLKTSVFQLPPSFRQCNLHQPPPTSLALTAEGKHL